MFVVNFSLNLSVSNNSDAKMHNKFHILCGFNCILFHIGLKCRKPHFRELFFKQNHHIAVGVETNQRIETNLKIGHIFDRGYP